MTTIESVLHENRLFAPDDTLASQANLSSAEAYHALCREAEEDYLGFWASLHESTFCGTSPSLECWMKTIIPSLSGLMMLN